MPATPDLLFKALSDSTRRAIFESLVREGEQAVRAPTSRAGSARPAVSRHLGVLGIAGPVRDRTEGRETHSGAEPRGIASLIDWLTHDGASWRDRLERLEDLPERMDE